MDAGRVRRLFLAALDLDSTQRAAFLEGECVSVAEREAVMELLSFDRGHRACDESNTIDRPIAELRRQAVSGRFGPYELLETIGRGGMGAVYKAERADGEVRQVVAIKIIEREWLDPKALERFRRERQLLSSLAHPNITRLLDAGTREDGRPYMVMEFVNGDRLEDHCRKHSPSIHEKLRLFLSVCRAVEYAHSKLVIHRDLKPSNIVVTPEGEPKLLDFGIARALDEADAQATNSLLLTPNYACPEQARCEPPSTAMDVYGLGAVLYYLLTGSAPHSMEGLTPIEMVRHLSGHQPAKPSALRPELSGDLENIVLKAMHIEPERRYGSARELAEDIENYLALRPVRATPDRVLYRVGRLVARRRWPLIAAAVAIIAVAVGAGSAWTERRRADEEAAIAKAVNEFLQNDLISQAGLRSQVERGEKADPDLKVRTLLDRAAISVHQKFRGLPKVEAAIRVAIGGAYQDLGLDEEARKQFERAFELRRAVSGRGAADTLAAANLLGSSLSNLGQGKQAEAVFRESAATGGRSPEARRASAEARYRLAMMAAVAKRHDALPMLEQAISEMRAQMGPEHETVMTALNQLGVLHLEKGNAVDAEKLFREVLKTRTRTLGPSHPDTLASMSELGVFCFRRSRFDEGEELLRKSAEGMEAVLGPVHPVTLSTLNNLTNVYSRHGLYAQSAAVRLRILEGERKLRGPDHPDTLAAAHNLAVAYQSNGKYTAAVKLQEQTLAARRRTLGPEHSSTLAGMRSLASGYRETGRLAESVKLANEALLISQRVMGTHVDTAAAMNELARTRKAQGQLDIAGQLFHDALQMRLKLLGPGNQSTLLTKTDLAGLLQSTGRFAESERMFQETLAVQRKLLGEAHPNALNTASELAVLYRRQGRLDESAELQQKVLETRRKALGAGHPNTLRAMRELAAVYREQGRFAEARPLLASALELVTGRETEGEILLGLDAADLKRELNLSNQTSWIARKR